MSNSRLISLCLVVSLLPYIAFANEPITSDGNEPIRFGVLPFIPPGVLEYRFSGLTQGFSGALHQPVRLETRASYEAFREALEQQAFDIALVQPWDYMAIRQNGYTGLVQKRKPLRAAFISLNESLSSLQQLKNKTIAFPDNIAAVTLSAKQSLKKVGLTESDYQALYHNDHQSCLLAVASRNADACVAGADYGSTSIEQAGRSYRIFAYADWMPPILLVVADDFSHRLSELQTWLLNLEDSEAGQKLLSDAYLDSVIAVRDGDYVEWFESLQ